MTLKVNKILHSEKSLYQDVLVFESETYGNVLVLDGVIQCTERDEFSYQEMIAHLPLASHPDPKKVLVIGGGDGGVVREVLKHNTVEQVVLCDIDEAVIRVSKQYLPHMSSLLSDPRVVVHIGDGFKFLAENTSSYDVIITDSSDPVGPAASLFQKPYFELLHAALTPGGHISTQAECLWLHLPLIHELRQTTRELFPIGFVVCSKQAGRDVKTPVRKVANTRYYNAEVHKAAFVLPEFGRVLIEEGRNVLPKVGRALATGPTKKVLLLGSGAVSRPCAEYVVRNPANALTIACRTLKSAQLLAADLPNATAIALDANSQEELDKAVAEHDLVISLIPYTLHASVIKAAIKGKTHVVTTSYINPHMKALEAEAKAAGIVVMNEIGLDPGVDHLYAIKTIDEVHAKGGKVKEFHSYCGGLPAPECSDNPLGYKFSWSPRGGLLALLNSASYLSKGQQLDIPGKDLMSSARPYYISPAFAYVAYPNRNSVPFREYYNIPEAETVVRGTLRYQGFPEFVKALVALGWLNLEEKEWLKPGLTWAQIMQKATGAADATESTLIARVKEVCAFPNEGESKRIIDGLKWIGFFSNEAATVRGGTLLDTLCAQLETLMKYEEGERDLVILQHKFIVEWADGKQNTITSTLEAYGDPAGHSAMAVYVGVPCGIAVQLVLDGVFKTPGIFAPYSKDICDPLRESLEKEGLGLTEKIF
ncbi:Saccharopine dehydrogenase [NADP(+), L-glutamate-forming] [Grifola frondosa]|uniref:Saccharopine dehydrogenase [NADP(+), L-glutamate-forming] n=1 Tax=Grifola frondosa TaxID=5627 RepID=A0A1C7M727_GRIFR|nr:Saccharopine dehydrogenase [NADP(+), L-glutamate-forming] [Grifola frondosa]